MYAARLLSKQGKDLLHTVWGPGSRSGIVLLAIIRTEIITVIMILLVLKHIQNPA